ncbi:NAD(P)-binding protein [Tricholoma matsutake]|nr:NAD(P)-binding protein [Tricholoma matsutake 945]
MATSLVPSNVPSTRVALVTGGAQGIGREIALRLASDGLDVAVDDIPSKLPLLEGVVNEIKAIGRKAIALTFDVSKEGEVKAMVEQTVAELGRIDAMIANAGVVGLYQGIMDADVELWESVWAVNIRGPLLCYKYAAKQMVKQGWGGRIVGASSICGLKGKLNIRCSSSFLADLTYLGYANTSSYCISKASVRSLTQSTALELEGHGITVNAYAPGVIETEMTTRDTDKALGGTCTTIKKVLNLPMNYPVGRPDVVAGLVSYLVSPEAHYISGQTISISGTSVLN